MLDQVEILFSTCHGINESFHKHTQFSLNASTPIVLLNTKLTVPRNSILDPQFSKTSRIEARVEFRDVRVEYEDACKSFRASQNEETKEFLCD